MFGPLNRRGFLQVGLVGAAALASREVLAADRKPKLKKAVKYGMIQIGNSASVEERFALIKRLGFEGVEMDSPSGVNRDEAVKARDKTGIVIHGVVDSVHWQDRLSDPDPTRRAKGLAALRTALQDARTYGATTVLLVPGKVSNKETENYDQVWSRSQAEVRKVLPLAERLGVKIAIEVVWNDFITTPEELIRYVDDFKSPVIGAYFDCSNMIRYGVKPSDWIRKLGKRMLKFDFKGFSMEKFRAKQNPWVPIGEGSEDWPAILEALAEIGYNGWATSEVNGGGEKHLRDVAQRMNRCLGLSDG